MPHKLQTYSSIAGYEEEDERHGDLQAAEALFNARTRATVTAEVPQCRIQGMRTRETVSCMLLWYSSVKGTRLLFIFKVEAHVAITAC